MYDKNTEEHIDNAVRHFKRQEEQSEAHHTKAALITFRKPVIENQKRHNYNNEYERLLVFLLKQQLHIQTIVITLNQGLSI